MRLIVFGFLALSMFGLTPRCALASGAPGRWVKGFNFTDWSAGGYADPSAKESIDRLRATGANAIALIPTWYQASPTGTTIAPARHSPTDESIAYIVRLAKSRGMKVFLRPVVDDMGETPRLKFAPHSPRAWFASYRAFINHYATLAAALEADMLSVGLEYHNLDGPTYESEWRRVIRGVRARFHGSLTYGANNADAWTHIRFWDALDVIGVDAYFTLSSGSTPGVDEIVARWHEYEDAEGVTHHYLQEIAALSKVERKPIVFTEFGYPSTANALVSPWAKGRSYSGAEQQRAFEAVFRALTGEPWFKGMYIWEWNSNPNAGGSGDGGHTPQGKPAEDTIRRWFTRTVPSASRRSIPIPRLSLRGNALTVRGTIPRRRDDTVRVVCTFHVRGKPIVPAKT